MNTQTKKALPKEGPRKTAAMAPLPIERALKTDILSILVAYQQQYSIPIHKEDSIVLEILGG